MVSKCRIWFVVAAGFVFLASPEKLAAQPWHGFHLGTGWRSYQLVPSQFQPDTGEAVQAGNFRRSPVYGIGYVHGTSNENLIAFVDLLWERSVSDITHYDAPAGALIIDHITLIAGLKFEYLSREYWGLGSAFSLGLGKDIGQFSQAQPGLEYDVFDYHYQLDLVAFRLGRNYGLEVNAGYGVRGLLYGGLFVKL